MHVYPLWTTAVGMALGAAEGLFYVTVSGDPRGMAFAAFYTSLSAGLGALVGMVIGAAMATVVLLRRQSTR